MDKKMGHPSFYIIIMIAFFFSFGDPDKPNPPIFPNRETPFLAFFSLLRAKKLGSLPLPLSSKTHGKL